ncbi:hypothetical protein BDN72DRAFT_897822 [Pluteus cervinus]|uniref:Uncharacterized protein n=1 Tax=Pluteus cervinus TaxID=181527 RepID=A0ACD3ATI2_9AGAR|nr:hypothetical protein BDN72DRAFT_897822 [Pluteus cervinus]
MQSLDDIDRECARTVKEIERLQGRLQELRTYHNQLVPISRLPVETLTDIFSTAQKIPSDFVGEYDSGRVATVTASVCRYWRQMMLSTPFLWNTIDVANAHWIECSLERSNNLTFVPIS